MTSDDERASKDEDVAAFMALPRVWLYGGAAIALIVFVGLSATVIVSQDVLGLWLPPIVTALIAVLIAGLRQSSVGRGALWTLAGNDRGSRVPRRTNLVWVVLTVILVAFPLYFRFAAGAE